MIRRAWRMGSLLISSPLARMLVALMCACGHVGCRLNQFYRRGWSGVESVHDVGHCSIPFECSQPSIIKTGDTALIAGMAPNRVSFEVIKRGLRAVDNFTAGLAQLQTQI